MMQLQTSHMNHARDYFCLQGKYWVNISNNLVAMATKYKIEKRDYNQCNTHLSGSYLWIQLYTYYCAKYRYKDAQYSTAERL